MKLILKAVPREILVTTLGDESHRYVSGPAEPNAPFALFAEDGTILPGQVTTTLHSERGAPTQLTVVFNVDGDRVKVEGHGV